MIQTFTCCACGRQESVEVEPGKEATEWTLHTMEFPQGNLKLLTCYQCTKKPIDWIFEAHKARIKAGKNIVYN